jgi:CheY-like chemotaxis protein
MRARELETAKAAAEAASVAKSQFLANMSHEIRTPMHGILGLAQLAMAPETSPEQSREHLEGLRGCAEGLLHVLNDILDFSKIEAGRLSVERMPFSLRSLLDETRRVILPQSSAKGLTLECRSAPGIPDSLLGDAARLRQVLINLLGNATKFTKAGSVTLEVSGAAPDRQGGDVRLLLRVSDTGIGIAPEHQQRIFDAFAQADASVTRQFGGTGLGLSICSQLVGLMGGRLWVESTPGSGSTFQFTCELGIGNQGNSRTAEAVEEMPPFQALRILLAEDHPISQLLAGRMLVSQGHQVTTVSTGAAAIERWESGEFDVILMDNHMPEMGGVEALRGIRDREAAAGRERTAVIALTASAMAGDRERFLAAGADDYLSKPFRAEELYATIQRVAARDGQPAILQAL